MNIYAKKLRREGGVSVQKTQRECAANMGSKISLLELLGLLVYEWFLTNAKFGIWKGRFLKILPNLGKNWLKFKFCEKKKGDGFWVIE